MLNITGARSEKEYYTKQAWELKQSPKDGCVKKKKVIKQNLLSPDIVTHAGHEKNKKHTCALVPIFDISWTTAALI